MCRLAIYWSFLTYGYTHNLVERELRDKEGTYFVLRYCRNVHPTWVKFNSKDTKESKWWFEFKEY